MLVFERRDWEWGKYPGGGDTVEVGPGKSLHDC